MTIERRIVALVGMVEDLGDRIEGRMENAARTVALHPDPDVRQAAAVREMAYRVVFEDLYALLDTVRSDVAARDVPVNPRPDGAKDGAGVVG